MSGSPRAIEPRPLEGRTAGPDAWIEAEARQVGPHAAHRQADPAAPQHELLHRRPAPEREGQVQLIRRVPADQVADLRLLRRVKKPSRARLRPARAAPQPRRDRKSTRLNSSHANISYAVFCLKKKNNHLLTE